jgi:hypothetical protein
MAKGPRIGKIADLPVGNFADVDPSVRPQHWTRRRLARRIDSSRQGEGAPRDDFYDN